MTLGESKLTKETAIQVMKDRGYSLVSSINRLTKEAGPDNVYIAVAHPQLCFAKDTDLNVHLHATVDLDREDISLEMVQLKLMITLNAQRFTFNHPLFSDIEKKMYNYAKACLEVDKTIPTYKGNKLPEPDNAIAIERPKPIKKTIEERKKAFWENEVKPIAKQLGHSKAFALEFFSYWTEHGPNDKKFRREDESRFDVARRMGTFVKNDKKWNKERKSFTEKKAEKQDQERKQKIKVIDKSKLF